MLFLLCQFSKMNKLVEKSNRLIEAVTLEFQRDILHSIKWKWRLISLIGARGVGKTTLLLQQMTLAAAPYYMNYTACPFGNI